MTRYFDDHPRQFVHVKAVALYASCEHTYARSRDPLLRLLGTASSQGLESLLVHFVGTQCRRPTEAEPCSAGEDIWDGGAVAQWITSLISGGAAMHK
jgi:hypothetical protein